MLTNYRDDSPRADTGQSIPEHLLTRRASNYLISKGLHGVIENPRVIARLPEICQSPIRDCGRIKAFGRIWYPGVRELCEGRPITRIPPA